MNENVRNFFAQLQRRPAIVAGHIESVDIDPQTGQQTAARISVGGNSMRIKVDPFTPPLANGDQVRLEQFGRAASAEYRLAGIEAGARSQTGLFGVLNDGTVLNGVAYPSGDYVFGKLDEGNLHIEDATGCLYHRVGDEIYGIEYPTGNQLYGHATKVNGVWVPDGPNVLIKPTGVYIRNGLTDALRLLSDGSLWAKGDFQARSLHIGAEKGAALVGGTVIDFDTNGQPIITTPRYGLRLYDRSGLPQIALLTGTVDNPDMPALLVGADNAESYLRWLDGVLRLKGYAIIDGGQLGGFVINTKRITATNSRVILVNENDLDFAEGLLLITGTCDAAGTIAWRKSAAAGHEDDYAGILTTFWEPGGPGVDAHAEMLIGVSDLFSPYTAKPTARVRLEASTPTSASSQRAYLELESSIERDWQGVETPVTVLRTNADVRVKSLRQIDGAPLVIANVPGEAWIGPGDFCFSTSQGTAGRLANNGLGIECVANGYAMYWQLRVPETWLGVENFLKGLSIRYQTTLANAYISKVSIVALNGQAGAIETLFEYSQPLGQGATGAGYADLLEAGLAMSFWPMLLRVDLAGVSDYGHVVVYGFKAEW